MGFAHKAIVAGAAGVAAAVIVGCGSSGQLLSQSQANTLNTQLNSVSEALSEHDCAAAQDDLSRFESTLNDMGGVDSTLLSNLTQGANTIQELTNGECVAPTRTTPPSKPKTTTTATQTDTTTTATQTDTSTDTTSTVTTSPNDQATDTTGGQSPTPSTQDTTGTPPVGSGGNGLGSDTVTTPEQSTASTTPAGSQTPTTPTTPATPPAAGTGTTPSSGGGGF